MNKVLLITGGTRGAGAATARLAATQGFAVCVNFLHNEVAAAALVSEIRKAGNVAHSFQADVGREAEVLRMFAHIDATFGPVTALVNNARTQGAQVRTEQLTGANVTRLFDTNVLGALLCTREAVRRMSTRQGGGGGSIINVLVPRHGSLSEDPVDQAAMKAAVDAMTTTLAQEVIAEGIRVNGVRPAARRTAVNIAGGVPNRADRAVPAMPMEVGSYATEAAAMICWLLSDKAMRTTGSFIDVPYQE